MYQPFLLALRAQAGALERDGFPFALPAVRAVESLRFSRPVTFFTGENGTGKSTLIEAIAEACGFNPEGGSRNMTFSTRASHSILGRCIAPVRSPRRPRDGYFLRAESFYNVSTYLEELDAAPGPGAPILPAYGGNSLHTLSHGESFYTLVTERFRGGGLYILDEPESALSPARQMALLARMKHLVDAGSQLIIATHSPILLAFPDAEIYELSAQGVKTVEYGESELVRLYRYFLGNPGRMLEELFGEEEKQ